METLKQTTELCRKLSYVIFFSVQENLKAASTVEWSNILHTAFHNYTWGFLSPKSCETVANDLREGELHWVKVFLYHWLLQKLHFCIKITRTSYVWSQLVLQGMCILIQFWDPFTISTEFLLRAERCLLLIGHSPFMYFCAGGNLLQLILLSRNCHWLAQRDCLPENGVRAIPKCFISIQATSLMKQHVRTIVILFIVLCHILVTSLVAWVHHKGHAASQGVSLQYAPKQASKLAVHGNLLLSLSTHRDLTANRPGGLFRISIYAIKKTILIISRQIRVPLISKTLNKITFVVKKKCF